MKIVLAPIMGITDRIYRTTFAQYFTDVDQAVAPFISSVQARSIKPSYLKDVLPENNPSLPVIPQILSNNADDFLFMAEKILDFGYTELNWNLGCPSPTVVNKKRGSGLLPFPERVGGILERIMPTLAGKLSIKLRLGRFHSQEIDALLPIFNQFPLTEIILHPRLGSQLYTGSVDIEAFAQALAQSAHKVVYNGDIRSVADFIRLRDRFPTIDTWMVGRGLLANPFLAAEIRLAAEANPPIRPKIPVSDKHCAITEQKTSQFDRVGGIPSLKSDRDMAILHSFHQALYAQYSAIMCGPSHLLARMKGVWGYFSENFTDPTKVRKKIHKTNSPGQYLDAVHHIFREDGLAL